MNRSENAFIVGWVDPHTGQACRRHPLAVKQWKYTHHDFPEKNIIFAIEGIDSKEDACEAGHTMLQFQLVKEQS